MTRTRQRHRDKLQTALSTYVAQLLFLTNPDRKMAGFKRGGFRGGGGGTFKKSYTKKRSSPDDDSAERASKKAKGDDDDEEGATLIIPKLETDDDGNPFIAVSMRIIQCG